MRRLSAFAVAAGLALTAFVASSPADAAYHLIRWDATGFCQIWDETIPTTPYPYNYTVASTSVPTLLDVIADKDALLRSGACAF